MFKLATLIVLISTAVCRQQGARQFQRVPTNPQPKPTTSNGRDMFSNVSGKLKQPVMVEAQVAVGVKGKQQLARDFTREQSLGQFKISQETGQTIIVGTPQTVTYAKSKQDFLFTNGYQSADKLKGNTAAGSAVTRNIPGAGMKKLAQMDTDYRQGKDEVSIEDYDEYLSKKLLELQNIRPNLQIIEFPGSEPSPVKETSPQNRASLDRGTPKNTSPQRNPEPQSVKMVVERKPVIAQFPQGEEPVEMNGVVKNDNLQAPNFMQIPMKIEEYRVPERMAKPTPVKTETATTLPVSDTSSGIPIQIRWEVSRLKAHYEQTGNSKGFQFIKTIIEKANSMIQTYFKVDPKASQAIKILPGNYCDFKVPKAMNYVGHFVMLVDIFDPRPGEGEVVAMGKACSNNPFISRNFIGRIALNKKLLISSTDFWARKLEYVATFVHESLHAMSFNNNPVSPVPNKPGLGNLAMLMENAPAAYAGGHWNEAFLPNEVMVPYSRPGSVLSVYTLEVFKLRSAEYVPSPQFLPYNAYLDRLKDVKELFKYQCPSTGRPSFRSFCSAGMKDEGRIWCTGDYTFKGGCSSRTMSNNCYALAAMSDSNCLDDSNPNQGNVYEYRGADARCFEHPTNHAMCLRYQIPSTGVVRVILGEATVDCTTSHEVKNAVFISKTGEKKSVKFVCPDISDFIEVEKMTRCPNMCHQNGYCSRGKCVCFNGYDPADNCKSELQVQDASKMFCENLA